MPAPPKLTTCPVMFSLPVSSLLQDSNNPETLVNLVVVSQHLGKPQEVSEQC